MDMKGEKIVESNLTTCEWIFHQLAVKNLNISAEQQSTASVIRYSIGKKKNYSIHYLTGQNGGLSRLKNIWPVIMTGTPLSVILSPGWLPSGCLPHKSNQREPFFCLTQNFCTGKVKPIPLSGVSKYQCSETNRVCNSIDKWCQFDFCFTNFGVILEYLESSITTKKATFRLSSKTVSWHVYTTMRDTRSSCGGPLTWKAQIHGSIHRANFDIWYLVYNVYN